MNTKKLCLVALAMLFSAVTVAQAQQRRQGPAVAEPLHSAWPENIQRTWVGPDYWANRLQDWRIADGRLECVEASRQKPMRVVHLLTAALSPDDGTLAMSVRTGPIESGRRSNPNAWTGFLIGAGGRHVDYRLTALVHHRPAEDGGLIAAVDGTGKIVFRDFSRGGTQPGGWAIGGAIKAEEVPQLSPEVEQSDLPADNPLEDVDLRLEAGRAGAQYQITLSAHDHRTGKLISRAVLQSVDPSNLEGSIALVSHLGPTGSKMGYWFRDWQVSGSKVVSHPQRALGPVLCAQHTLSRGVLKMTAQMPPLGKHDTQTAQLQIRHDGNQPWQTVATATLVADSYTFPFRVENWDSSKEAQYQVVYPLRTGPDSTRTCTWQGTIRKEPTGRETFTIAAFTGHKIFTGGLKWNHHGIWFPHNELVAAVKYHKPDLLFFSGDNIYEGDLTGAQRSPLDKAILDYLDKWYRWCWAFGDLARDVPCVAITDDHDMYHGNIWGAGGRHASSQDDGGYRMDPAFVNMVQRTQTSHLPDPYDPTPVEQGIEVYYTSLDYAGVSFAVLEDRKWKSSPTKMVPKGKVVNGWFHSANFDPAAEADVPGAKLLGQRQLEFLSQWSADWSNGVWMKVVLSQTIFASVATLPREAASNGVVPRLKRYPPDVFPSDDKPTADADSNGWPQTGRNKALRQMRRGFAFHIAGDQHLGSFVQYGIDDWDDAGFALCVPSIANTWPRRWYPPSPGRNHRPDQPPYTGQYLDGFGNHIHVHAVSNPVLSGKEPSQLYDRAPGYGIVRFSRTTRDIVVECWPRWVDPSQPGAKQYLGWPVTVNQLDCFGRSSELYLPALVVKGMTDPVVQVTDERDGAILYTVRIQGESFRPKVLKEGTYTVRIGQPGTPRMKTIKNLRAVKNNNLQRTVEF